VTIVEALADPNLFAPWFRDRETWRAWFVFLRALFGLPMTADDLALYKQCTGRDEPPAGGAREAWLVVGRRGGKSMVLALIAVFLACFCDWAPFLSPGERGTIMVLAADRRQARTIYRYAHAMLARIPMLAELIERETAEAIDLTNGVTIEIMAASFRSVRGYTVIAALCDEIAFWRSEESSNPDAEIVAALRPAMATIPDAMLLCASSPYARRGVLWDAFRRHFGRAGSPLLVWKADTRTMNPTVPQSLVDEAMEADPASAAAEYGAEFRTDVETFVAREVVEAAVVPGRYELPPVSGAGYAAFVDPSGGSADSMTLAIAHADKDGRAVLDAVRERKPPFSPDDVVLEFSALLKRYRVNKVRGDRYAGEWPRERFRARGITYEVAERPKSDIYRDLLPVLNSGRAQLLDVPRLVAQFCSLERRTARGGRDSIDHAPGGHDDMANCVAGALLLAIDAGPALWRPEGLLVEGAPVPMPGRCDCVFAVLTASRSGHAAAIYFGRGRMGDGPLLFIFDCEAGPLAPALFHRIPERLGELAAATRARGAFLFTSGALAGEARRLGYRAQVIDRLAAEDDGLLALAAAVHIGAGRVKITAEALAKAEHHPLGGILDATAGDADDPLRAAALIGVALALDEGRSLTARAA
jgi:hypothetical protein